MIQESFRLLGKAEAANELLSRLQKHPDWILNLRTACSVPELELDELEKHILVDMGE